MVDRPDPSLPLRLVVDLRMFNNITVPKDANLPRTDQLPYYASRGGYLSELDLTKGFYHIYIYPKSREFLGIATQPGGTGSTNCLWATSTTEDFFLWQPALS